MHSSERPSGRPFLTSSRYIPPLIAREAERAVVRERLLAAEAGLLTLTGAGGCGKTSLGLAVAHDALGEFPDGAWLVEFAPHRSRPATSGSCHHLRRP
jgi:hypothetical protein